jgi:uncharacterized protein YfaS (alpha-2-macroglobulin family)
MSDPRNLAIAALAIVALVLGALLVRDRVPVGTPEPPVADLEAGSLLDVVLDRNRMRTIDLIFDRPLGEKRVGEVLAPEPIEISPRTGGSWRWHGANVLRFTATRRLVAATEYSLDLDPERLLRAGQRFEGDARISVVTDRFQVDRVDVQEDSVSEGAGQVELSGTLRFNYPVAPEELGPRLELVDPDAPDAGDSEPIALRLESPYQGTDIAFRAGPLAKGREERTLLLRVAADLTAADGNVPLGSDFTHEIALGSRERLVVRGYEARSGEESSTVELRFSSPVDPEIARSRLTLEPALEVRARAEGNRVLLSGAFELGRRYALRLPAGLPARDGSELQEDYAARLTLPDLPASVDFESSGMYLAARGAKRVAVESVNVREIHLTLERVYRNNVLYLFELQRHFMWNDRAGRRRIQRAYGDRVLEKRMVVGGERNRRTRTALDVEALLAESEDPEPGLYRLVVAQPDRRWESRQRWILVTELGIVAKHSRDDLLVWVSQFSDLAPVAWARVRLLSDQNQVLAEGRTDPRGLLHLRGLSQRLGEERPAMLTVQRGDDWSFLPFEGTRIETAGLDVAGATPAAGYDGYLYGERDLYRPGETARGVAVLRDAALGTPPPMPAVLRHRDPRGDLRGETRLEIGEGGVAEWEVPFPEYALTGKHQFELRVGDAVVGRHALQVEEFVPDRIEVEIEPEARDGSAPGPGDALAYAVRGAYLFGAPGADLAVETHVRLEKAPFVPPGRADFTFGNPRRKLEATELFRAEERLDADGLRRFELRVPENLRPPAALVARIQAHVRERGGRGVAAREQLAVHAYRQYVGLRRTREGYAEPGRPESFEYVVVTPEGVEAEPGRLEIQLYRDRYHSVLRRTPSGAWRYESKSAPELLSERAVDGGGARGSFEFTPEEYGSHRVVITDSASGASTELRFHASGWGFAPWALEDPGLVELELEREDHVPGGTARVQVRTPFPGRLLLTVERDHVLHQEIHTLEGNTATLTLPVRDDWRPNVFVTATLVRSAAEIEPGSAGRAFGAVPLEVDRARHRLVLDLEAPERVRSESPLELAVKTRPGARVTLAAVDEGILQLAAQQTPDPFAHFYRRRALTVAAHDSFGLLFPEEGTLGAAAAGGGALQARMQQFVRTAGIRRVTPVAFWSGVVVADDAGFARARFAVPAFQGALRVMAVAQRGADFGSSELRVHVRDPLILTPTPPRFLSLEEEAQLPVTLRNETGTVNEFTVALATEGPVDPVGETTRRLSLDAGEERTLYFAVSTGDREGEVGLAFTAEGGGESARSRVALGIRAHLPARARSLVGSAAQRQVALDDDPLTVGLREQGRRRSLRISPLPLLQLHGQLAALLRYPYGCLEQTTSRAFPLVYIGALARELEPELFEEHDPDALVAAALARVAGMQRSDGGFSLWPGGQTTQRWASIYATHFLVEARRAGHQVPEWVLDPALDFLATEVRSVRGSERGGLERAVYALYVLARAERGDAAGMDFLREKRLRQLPRSARSMLAAAYAAHGRSDVIAELVSGLDASEEVRRETGGNFRSTTRDRALLLLSLLDARPDDALVPELAARLARDAELQTWSTQETAWALLALGQLGHRQSQRAPYAGELRVGGESLGRFGPETAVFDPLPEGAVELLLDEGYGPGAAFYALEVRGTPTDEGFRAESHGIELARELRNRDGGPLPPEGPAQGDLIQLRIRLRSESGRLENLVVQQLLPSGLEIENPRLASSEELSGKADKTPSLPLDHLDVRDDRLLLFSSLPDTKRRSYTALLRAVVPGRFRLPPIQAEAMYDPALRATGERGELAVRVRE